MRTVIINTLCVYRILKIGQPNDSYNFEEILKIKIDIEEDILRR